MPDERTGSRSKKYQREFARRKRRRRWEAATSGRSTCPARLGPRAVCGARLERFTDGNGRVLVRCPLCERKARGICRECPLPVDGRPGFSLRCRVHKAAQLRRAHAKHRRDHHAEILANAKRRREAEPPERRQAKLAYKKLYRQAHPEKVKAQKRREALRGNPRKLSYMKRYNARRRRERADLMLARYQQRHPAPAPTCADCDRPIPWDTRLAGESLGRPPKRCTFCLARHDPRGFVRAVLKWAARADRPEPRRRLRLPKLPTAPRTCLTVTCTAIMTGRQKKCPRCIEAERQAALETLLVTHGRRRNGPHARPGRASPETRVA